MPATDLLARKTQELRFKLASLPDELKLWQKRADAPALEKNRSQIQRLTMQLAGMQAQVETEFSQAVEAGELWPKAASLERKALVLHMIWDAFRSKLALRSVAPFDRYLALADAFSRECYLPVYRHLREIAADALCPAPLVTFDTDISPWSRAADSDGLMAEADVGVLTASQLQDCLNRLPLTTLGLPWCYLAYLPHMALLAHEAGHAIEHGAGATDTLDGAIAAAPLADEARRPAWQAWRKELFADIYACRMAGPAFGWSLADRLSDDPGAIAKQRRPYDNGDWTDYPTATLRVLLVAAALERFGFRDAAQGIRGDWRTVYQANPLADFVADFPAVIDALSVPAGRDGAGLGFTAVEYGKATTLANLLRLGGTPSRAQPFSARTYVTAAWLLVHQPSAIRTLDKVWDALLEHHLVSRPPGAAGAGAEEPQISEVDERVAGAALADALFAGL